MAQRRHHYETAFEDYLRSRRVPYVAVDEAKKALIPESGTFRWHRPPEGRAAEATGGPDEPGSMVGRSGPGASLKSFDFVVYADEGNLLLEVKGRKLTRRLTRSLDRSASLPRARVRGAARLDSWVTLDDVESLRTWEGLFGAGFSAVFVFVYWCDEPPASSLFEEIFEHRGRWYALRAIALRDYARAMKLRSPRWRTMFVPPTDFERLSRTFVGAAPAGAIGV